VLFAAVLLLVAGSCGPQKYSSHRGGGHPKGCDCPKFK
jgi:hypothetical protein